MRGTIIQGRNLAGTLVLALSLAAGLASRPAAADPERHTIPGTEVVIYNLVGSLEIVPGTGSSVVAEVTLQGPDASRLRIAKGTIRGKETLRVIYPGDRILVPEFENRTTSTIRVRDDGTFSDERSGHGSDGRKVVLSGKEGIEASADIRILVPKGKKLGVKWGHGDGTVSGLDASVDIDAAHMPVTVTDMKGALAVDIGSGSVTVQTSSGPIAIDTGSGEVELRNLHGGPIVVDTGSGEVVGVDLDSDPLSISTGSGGIRIKDVRSNKVALDSGSGEITVALHGSMKSLVVDTGSGDVSVMIPHGAGAELSAETGSGDIETNLVLETRHRRRNEVSGRIGDGSGRIRIETGSGNITLVEDKKK